MNFQKFLIAIAFVLFTVNCENQSKLEQVIIFKIS